MDKAKASKKPTPSLRTKKKGSTDRMKSTSRPSGTASKNTSSTKQTKKDPSQHSKRDHKNQAANAGRSVMVMDREPVTDNDKNKKKETPPPKKEMKKKVMSAEAEKKLDRTQEDVQDVKAGVGATETISNIEVLPDKNPAKMDDGYEDFGPGAA